MTVNISIVIAIFMLMRIGMHECLVLLHQLLQLLFGLDEVMMISDTI